MKNQYWDNDKMDKWIDSYKSENNSKLKELIYMNHLHLPFTKLTEYVVNTWKWNYINESREDLTKELLCHLITSTLPYYNRKTGKSFAFFSVSAKHYLIQKNKRSFNKIKKEEPITTSGIDDNKERILNKILNKEEDLSQNQRKELFYEVIQYFEKHFNEIFTNNVDRIKIRYQNIGKAIIHILKESDIQYNNKCGRKGFLKELKSITKYTTTQIRPVMDIVAAYYEEIKKSYLKNDPVIIIPEKKNFVYWKNYRNWESSMKRRKNYNQKNKEKITEYQKKYQKEYYENNKEKIKKQKKEYYYNNK